MNAILISFFGTSNIGDLLISGSLNEKVSKFSKVTNLDYLGKEVIEQVNIEKAIDSYTTKKKSTKFLKYLGRKTFLNQVFMRLKRNMDLFSFPEYEENLNTAEAVIIGGGNMIFDLEPDTLSAKRFDYYVTKAKEKNLPVYAISLGIGPFQNKYQQKYSVKALEKCDYITFRDNHSLELFKEYNTTHPNVKVVPDPVFFLDSPEQQEITKKIGLNIINPQLFDAQFDRNMVKDDYKSLVKNLLAEFEEDIIIYNTEAKDFDFCAEVYEAFSNNERVTLFKVNSLEDLYEVYSETKLIIGTRMHSLITAFSQGQPIVGISWQQKVDAMFELLNDPQSVFRIDKIDEELEDIIKRVRFKLDTLDEYENKYFVETMDKLKKLEEVNLQFLSEIFN